MSAGMCLMAYTKTAGMLGGHERVNACMHACMHAPHTHRTNAHAGVYAEYSTAALPSLKPLSPPSHGVSSGPKMTAFHLQGETGTGEGLSPRSPRPRWCGLYTKHKGRPAMVTTYNIILSEFGEPLIPCGGSCCKRLKSLIRRCGADEASACPHTRD